MNVFFTTMNKHKFYSEEQGKRKKKKETGLVFVTGRGGAGFNFVTPLLRQPGSTLHSHSLLRMTSALARLWGRAGISLFPLIV